MFKQFKYLEGKVSQKEFEYLIKFYGNVLQSIGTLIQDKLNSYEGTDITLAFCIVEGAIRDSHENILVQIFKDTSVEEIDELISKISENTKELVISRVKDTTDAMPFVVIATKEKQ